MKDSFIFPSVLKQLSENYTFPLYVYSENNLREAASEMLIFPSAFGHSVRYAMKANPNQSILKLFASVGLKFEASSVYELERALYAGVKLQNIQISAQEITDEVIGFLQKGVFFVATSLHQIEYIGQLCEKYHDIQKEIGVRINPVSGSGAFKKISTGGKTSAFGIWYEYIEEVKNTAQKYNLKIIKYHQHIGSENTPESWVESAKSGLEIIRQLPDVEMFDMGGGFKMAIMPYEKTADLQNIGKQVSDVFQEFFEETGRKLHLEIEPGKYLVINSCSLIAKVVDIVDTGLGGHMFIKTNTGMTELPRITMYGVQQPISIFSSETFQEKVSTEQRYAVVGHCCESGDLMTCKLYEQEVIEERNLPKIERGDIIVFGGSGAYSSAMSMKNYNSFPEAGEAMILSNGEIKEIRKRQTFAQIVQNEISIF